jgi:gliding motility-associated-like protein
MRKSQKLCRFVCMKGWITGIWWFAAMVLAPLVALATHNRAGEITYRQTGPLSIEMTIITYTKASSTAADRDSLEVFWGDGTRQFVVRNDSRTRFEANDIKINYYTAPHTYPGVATYTISFQDPNRVGGILNVNYPNSIDIPFYLSTTFTLLDQQFQGFNNSAILLQPPIDIGCVNKLFIHNPNGYDIDGDSLAYELAAPLQALGTPVPGYKLPDQIGPAAGNVLTINATTGEVRWNSPKLQGEYNIAIRIKEFRNGKLINVIFRDMQILIKACDNEPPIIDALDEICVIAGEKITIPIRVNDANALQRVKLTATGGPFTLPGKATLSGPAFFSQVPFQATVEWQTQCNHISDQYYQIVLRAVDNFNPDSTGLATLKTIRIKVVGPAPEQLRAQTEEGSIKLTWTKPYDCEIVPGGYFQGFSVWRKIASANFQPDTCNPGLTGSAYIKIAFRTNVAQDNQYFWYDTTAERGLTYCYRVQAEFARLTLSGNPFNRVESLPSNETCQILMRDLPLVTRASVQATSINQGEIFVRWTKPLADELDTLANPGPYQVDIWRKESTGQEILPKTVLFTSLSALTDTFFVDAGLNTSRQQYRYFISFFSKDKLIGKSALASTVFLKVLPSDGKNILQWQSQTPWSNFKYDIFQVLNAGNQILLGSTSDTSWVHSGLNNDSVYCYAILAKGTYAIPSIEDPLENWSQTVCQSPEDNVPPCTPVASVSNVCDQLTGKIPETDLFNTLKWSVAPGACGTIDDDVSAFAIYYGETTESPLEKIAEVPRNPANTFIHFPVNGLLGCYAVSAIDSVGNESAYSTRVCVDNCPFFELPNTFTPNGDGYNDLFKPRINLFIHEIDLKVYNTWGNLVFTTSNPAIDWNGLSDAGKELSAGTYYYTCRVFEKRVTGITESPSPLQGFIHIIK